MLEESRIAIAPIPQYPKGFKAANRITLYFKKSAASRFKVLPPGDSLEAQL